MVDPPIFWLKIVNLASMRLQDLILSHFILVCVTFLDSFSVARTVVYTYMELSKNAGVANG